MFSADISRLTAFSLTPYVFALLDEFYVTGAQLKKIVAKSVVRG